MISEFLVISPRGDTLITKSYMGTVNRSTADLFLQYVQKEKSEGRRAAPPVFLIDGVTYCHLQLNQMFFLLTTTKNVQSAILIELLQRLSRVFKVRQGNPPPSSAPRLPGSRHDRTTAGSSQRRALGGTSSSCTSSWTRCSIAATRRSSMAGVREQGDDREQGMSTELLKAYIYNEPVAVHAPSSGRCTAHCALSAHRACQEG
eukprot:383351-Hanusia_phi.AAC.1